MFRKILIASLIFISGTSFATQTDVIKEKIKHAETKEDAIKIIENSGKPLTLFNYVLDKKVQIQKPGNLSAEEGAQFIPQTDEFLDLYMNFLDEGMKTYEAMIMTYTSPEAIALIKKAKQKESPTSDHSEK